MKMYIAKDNYTYEKRNKILLIPEIYEQIIDNKNRTGIVYKHSSFNIRYGSYDNLYGFEEVTVENSYKYLRQLKMLNTAVHREKEKKDWGCISHKSILMFYDEFIEMYALLFIKGCDKKC